MSAPKRYAIMVRGWNEDGEYDERGNERGAWSPWTRLPDSLATRSAAGRKAERMEAREAMNDHVIETQIVEVYS